MNPSALTLSAPGHHELSSKMASSSAIKYLVATKGPRHYETSGEISLGRSAVERRNASQGKLKELQVARIAVQTEGHVATGHC